MKRLFKRLAKRLHELVCRVENFNYWRARGLPVRTAWKKADLTFTHPSL